MLMFKKRIAKWLLMLVCCAAVAVQAQTVHRQTRLILKDGSYQTVTQYTVKNGVVHYSSAERNDAEEEIPADLVDWDATHAWEKAHGESSSTAMLDSDLAKEEADIASRTPEVAPNLKLPVEGSVLALDLFDNGNELVNLPQSDSDLNKNTAHNILKATINPIASSHQLIQLKGIRAQTQLHTGTPVIYVRIGDNLPPEAPADAFTVDTHGADNPPGGGAAVPAGGAAGSQYVIVRADVRTDVRVVGSFKITMLGQVSRQEDVMETTSEILPGGHWMKLTPAEALLPGEYALMEVLSPKEVNLGVWDFGVHSDAPENQEVILPVEKKPMVLQRR
jgi:hypothetical protein